MNVLEVAMSKSKRSPKTAAQNLGQSLKEEPMSDETDEKFDPSEHKAAEVVEQLEEASEEEKLQIAAAEQAGKNRKSVLEAAGVEGDVRLDASGRQLNGWEVAPTPAEEA